MAWALVYQKIVLEVREEKFPVSDDMKWVEVDPTTAKENYILNENGEIVPPIPEVIEPPKEKIDIAEVATNVEELKTTAENFNTMINDLMLYSLGKMTKEDLEKKYPDIHAILGNK